MLHFSKVSLFAAAKSTFARLVGLFGIRGALGASPTAKCLFGVAIAGLSTLRVTTVGSRLVIANLRVVP